MNLNQMMAIDLSCKIEGHFLGGSQVIGHARRILLSFAVENTALVSEQ